MGRAIMPNVVPTIDTGFSRSLLVDPGTGELLNDPGVIVGDRVTTDATVSNTVTETSVYSLLIPPDVLETDRTLMLLAQCLITDSAATFTNRTLTFKLKYGTTTIATAALVTSDTDGVAAVTGVGTSIGYQLTALLSADGSTAAQVAHLAIAGPLKFSQLAAGRILGSFGSGTARGLGTVDSTLEKLLDLTVTWSEASTSCIFTLESAKLVLL